MTILNVVKRFLIDQIIVPHWGWMPFRVKLWAFWNDPEPDDAPVILRVVDEPALEQEIEGYIREEGR